MPDALIIDMHAHVYRTPEIARQAMENVAHPLQGEDSIAELRATMREAGIWRTVIVLPGRRSRRRRCRSIVATSFTSVWPKRLPMQIREPPPNGT